MARPQRLLFVTPRFPPDIGGVARSSARIAGALAGLGVEVDAVVWTRQLPPGSLETRALAPNLVLHRVGLFAAEDAAAQHTLGVLEWLHGQRGFQAVWGHFLQPSGFVAALFAGLAGLPLTVSARGNDVDTALFPPGDLGRLRWVLERARVVSAVSEDMARKVRLLAPSPVQVLHNAVDLETFAPRPADPALAARWGLAPGEAVLGFCGELRHKKGAAFLFDALAAVRASRAASLLVIGELRARDQGLLQAFAAAHPEDAARIRVTGHLESPREVADALALCDLVLLPSLWEGLPNALLEAMACGKAALASDAGGIPEVIRHGVDGFIVPRPQLHRLGQAALELLEAPAAQREAWGRAARARVESAFGPAQEAAALCSVLERLTPSSA
jgi:glycosyltransferase involved in cell wall biosynthesis